jgi:hypothetical protein
MRSVKIFTIIHTPSHLLPPFVGFIEAPGALTEGLPEFKQEFGVEMVQWVTEADADDQEEMSRIVDFMLDSLTAPFEYPTTIHNSPLS